jgi:hypothetical protein
MGFFDRIKKFVNGLGETKRKGARYGNIIMPAQGDGNCYANAALSAASNLLETSRGRQKVLKRKIKEAEDILVKSKLTDEGKWIRKRITGYDFEKEIKKRRKAKTEDDNRTLSKRANKALDHKDGGGGDPGVQFDKIMHEMGTHSQIWLAKNKTPGLTSDLVPVVNCLEARKTNLTYMLIEKIHDTPHVYCLHKVRNGDKVEYVYANSITGGTINWSAKIKKLSLEDAKKQINDHCLKIAYTGRPLTDIETLKYKKEEDIILEPEREKDKWEVIYSNKEQEHKALTEKEKNLAYDNFDLKERVKRMKNDEIEKEKMRVSEKYLEMELKKDQKITEQRKKDAKKKGWDPKNTDWEIG